MDDAKSMPGPSSSPSPLRACASCGLVQQIPPLLPGYVARCSRCAARMPRVAKATSGCTRALIATILAFLFFWPAILLPILEVERFGLRHQSSILGGAFELLRSGEWFVGAVVLLFSVVLPFVKIVMLLELTVIGMLPRPHRAMTYRFMELLGRWSMLDVLLLALLVMLVKVGSLVAFHIRFAVFPFVVCVALTMLASWMLDPHAIWEDCGEVTSEESVDG